METIKRRFRVDRREIIYLRYTIESYDGMAVVKTIEPHGAVLELQIAPGCEGFIDMLLCDLRENEKLRIMPL